ncbi:MAG: hypothetical protein UX10_C0009G0011 [Candidatus Magasanikbacteria bacterium GW2011_GWA2_45_39]|uniref:Vitamin K epoxide reductase domain-containing protein n=2 Tax=Candidatus Magasanikiibacteriota TaxID=1752731 RepID=A0A0G1QZW6_9BACT|nr:MAG: hypothetical protein UX10_C0009G0011 [Candidatus Magasanikbacteria bacterium GW2011_GWA2_45_39]KKU14185.1 MAG: hypothetical protein UX20_C0004G0012 [Candidatus Magasanikbacteria bacterium GW2011_GWC2_45_8]
MMNFKNSLTMWWQKNHNIFPHHFFILFVILILVGLVDSSYLAALHIRGVAPTCNVLKGCEQVATSVYSSLFSVPVAFFGLAYYMFLFLFVVYIWERQRSHLFHYLIGISTIGLLASIYFFYLQVVVIHALCLYCIISGIDTLIFWLLATQLIRFNRQNII